MKDDRPYIEHILEAIRRIDFYSYTAGDCFVGTS